MTTLTLITAAVVLYGLLSKHGYGRALALGGVTAAGSAAYVGGVGVPTFYATALIAAALVVGRTCLPKADDVPQTGDNNLPLVLLTCFVLWTTFITLVAPFFFSGNATVVAQPGVLTAGAVTTSNLAQIIYLFLGLAVVAYFRVSKVGGPDLIGIATGACTVLSAWRYLSQTAGLPFPEGLFDNSPSFTYIETAAGGVQRFRGILSEPAGLASNCLITIFYMVPRAARVRGWRRAGCLALAAVGLYLGLISTSTTFIVAGIISLAVVALVAGAGFISRRTSVSRTFAILGALGVAVLVWALPILYSLVAETLKNKVASSSYTDRSTANQDALLAFYDSFGVGIGAGSVRASSFFPTLLGATGAVGTALFVAAVVVCISRSATSDEYRPVVWALVTFLIIKIAAGPDLSDSSGILWIGLGLLGRPRAAADSQISTISRRPHGHRIPFHLAPEGTSRGAAG